MWTKNLAEHELKGNELKSYLGGSLQLVYTENNGGMLSIGDDLPDDVRFIIFRIISGLMLAGILAYTIFKEELTKFQFAILLLILGGGFGNLIDRIANNGLVIDFAFIQIFGLRTGIFNIADVYITVGVVLLIVSIWASRYADSEIKY